MTTQVNPNSVFGHYLNNLHVFHEFKRLGFDYILNPETGELHKVLGGTLSGSHNLKFAELVNFIGIANLESIPIHWNFDGTPIPVYDLVSGDFLGEYTLKKCKHCFPHLK